MWFPTSISSIVNTWIDWPFVAKKRMAGYASLGSPPGTLCDLSQIICTYMYAVHVHGIRVYTHVHTYVFSTHVTVTRRNPPPVWCDIAWSVLAGPPRWPSRTVAEKSIASVVWCGVAASLFQVAACLCLYEEGSQPGRREGRRACRRASEQASKQPSDRARTGENESPARHTLCRGRHAIEFPPSAPRDVYVYTHVYTLRCDSIARLYHLSRRRQDYFSEIISA